MNTHINGPGLSKKEILEIYRNKRLSRVNLAKKYGIKAADVGRIKNGTLFLNITHNNGATAAKIKREKNVLIKDYIAETERELRDTQYQSSLYANRVSMLENQLQILRLQQREIIRS